MSNSAESRPTIGPGCRVAVFPSGATRGATLGYYGTIVTVCGTATFPYGQPLCFWVDVPVLNGVVHVRAADMLAVQECQGGEQLVCAADCAADQLACPTESKYFNIAIDSPIAHDNTELCGEYRIGPARVTFRFAKDDVPCVHYKLAIPAGSGKPPMGRLHCTVPRDRILDCQLVHEAICQVLGIAAAN